MILDNELKTTTSNKLLIENSLKEDVSNDSEDYKDIFSNIKHLYNDRMIYDIETLKEIFEDKLEKNKNLAGNISEEMLEKEYSFISHWTERIITRFGLANDFTLPY